MDNVREMFGFKRSDRRPDRVNPDIHGIQAAVGRLYSKVDDQSFNYLSEEGQDKLGKVVVFLMHQFKQASDDAKFRYEEGPKERDTREMGLAGLKSMRKLLLKIRRKYLRFVWIIIIVLMIFRNVEDINIYCFDPTTPIVVEYYRG